LRWNELVLGHWAGVDRPAIVDDDGVVTGQQLLELAAGAAAWFAWGSSGDELEPSLALNAAEAIDLLLRALEGEAEAEP